MVVKIAARQSDLARLQAYEVGRALEQVDPSVKIEYSFRSSLGDQRADDPLWKMPEKGVFTEDFVADLQSGRVDLVVHSWKDLPIQDRDGTRVVATLPRADSRDVLLVRRDRWEQRKVGETFRILTSSPRRLYNLEPFLKWALPWKAKAPAIEFSPVRGNIATRVGKLVSPLLKESADALVVAKAALDRLLTSAKYGEAFPESQAKLREDLMDLDFIVLPLTVNPSAAAQGALAIEVRNDRKDLIALCEKIDSAKDRACVEEERAELARHGGGCHQKIGVSVLDRPYGKVRFIRGLTDAGIELDSVELEPTSKLDWPRASSIELIYLGETVKPSVLREAVSGGDLAEIQVLNDRSRRGYFVARADAWPEGRQREKNAFVWVAGLATWKKLVGQGVWVHGSAEGLGEVEAPRLDILSGRPIEWLRLTHELAARGVVDSLESRRAVGTYRLLTQDIPSENLKKARYFYWRSGSHFKAALAACPEIQEGYHGVGPGHTYHAVRAQLIEARVHRGFDLKQATDDVAKRLAIFLNGSDFSRKVTQHG